MKGLETGKDKVRKICEELKRETLDPALQEAERIREQARLEAEALLSAAKIEASRMIDRARQEIERQKAVFQASIAQAVRQTLEFLKEKIEDHLFQDELGALLRPELQSPPVIARLVTAIVTALEKEGTEADLEVYIAAAVPPGEVARLLAAKIVDRLKEKGVLLSSIGGGVEVRVVQDQLTIDLSDEAVRELIANYIRKDFRDLVFKS
jgi:V/A-type H+-transporting ATPase subunit E